MGTYGYSAGNHAQPEKGGMDKKSGRIIAHHEAHAWCEEVFGMQDDWIQGKITTEEAIAFVEWSRQEIQSIHDVKGIEPESGKSYDENSRLALEAFESSWRCLANLSSLFKCLSDAPTEYGGDDLATVRRSLITSQKNLGLFGKKDRQMAIQIRNDIGIPTTWDL